MYGYCNVLASAAAATMTPVRLIAHEMAAIVGRSRDGSLWRQNGPVRSINLLERKTSRRRRRRRRRECFLFLWKVLKSLRTDRLNITLQNITDLELGLLNPPTRIKRCHCSFLQTTNILNFISTFLQIIWSWRGDGGVTDVFWTMNYTFNKTFCISGSTEPGVSTQNILDLDPKSSAVTT